MSGEQPADPYTHWRRRAEAAEAEVARLNMEMEAYRQKLTPKDAQAMTAVIKALNEEKDRCPNRFEDAVHDAITRALAEAGVKSEMLIGMCIEVGLEAYRDAIASAHSGEGKL